MYIYMCIYITVHVRGPPMQVKMHIPTSAAVYIGKQLHITQANC